MSFQECEGLEQEWVFTVDDFVPGSDTSDFTGQVLEALDTEMRRGHQSHDGHTSYGGRIYLDHFLPETSTPEISRTHDGPWELARYIAADDQRMVAAAKRASVALTRAHRRRVNIGVSKVVSTREGDPVGSHENYRLPSDHASEINRLLEPFLVARAYLTESGAVIRSDDTGWAFIRAGKAKLGFSDGDLGVVHPEQGTRLEVRRNGPNQSQAMNAFKFGSTRLVIREISHRLTDGRNGLSGLPELAGVGAGQAFSEINNTDGQKERCLYIKHRGRRFLATASEVLEIYRSELTQSSTADQWVLDYWDRLATAMKSKNHEGAIGLVEWVTLKAVLEEVDQLHQSEHGVALDFEQAFAVYQAAGAVSTHEVKNSLLDKFTKGLRSSGRLHAPGAVLDAVENPPSFGPAAIRGAAIKALGDAGQLESTWINWHFIQRTGDEAPILLWELADAGVTSLPDLEDFVSPSRGERHQVDQGEDNDRYSSVARTTSQWTRGQRIGAAITGAVLGGLAAAFGPNAFFSARSAITGPETAYKGDPTYFLASDEGQRQNARPFEWFNRALPDPDTSAQLSLEGTSDQQAPEPSTFDVELSHGTSNESGSLSNLGPLVVQDDAGIVAETLVAESYVSPNHQAESMHVMVPCSFSDGQSRELRISVTNEDSIVRIGNVRIRGCNIESVAMDNRALSQIATPIPRSLD